jgi:hypothetical protein
MLLQVLRALEGLSAKVAFVRLEWNMHTDVRSDMVTLHSRSAALIPLAGEVQVVGAFPAHMPFTDVVLPLASMLGLPIMSMLRRYLHRGFLLY